MSKVKITPFRIEKNIPLPQRGDSLEVREFKEKVKEIIVQMKVGYSFVIPFAKTHTFQNFVKKQFPGMSFRCSRIKDNKKFTRVWRRK